jgi:plastocyanin
VSKSVLLAICGALAASGALVSCHLADDPEPPKCGKYQHAENGFCVQDTVLELRVVLEAADGGCPSFTPATIKALVGEYFQFENKDDKPHAISGSDNQVWVNVPAKDFSDFVKMSGAGRFTYRVDQCPGGTVIVE